MKKIVLGLLVSTFSAPLTFGANIATNAGSYCLAVRGNGELAPAHWGALAQVVERRGLPAAMSGGSSASISLFLLESIAMNSNVAGQSPSQQRLAGSLFLKSLQGYLEVVAEHPESKEMAGIAQYFKKVSGGTREDMLAWLKAMAASSPQELATLVVQHGAQVRKSFELAAKVGIVNPQTFQPLLALLQESATARAERRAELLPQIQFLAGEIHQSITLLGAFNAESDQNLFFRSGIVNFNALAESFGRIGDFYAQNRMTSAQTAALSKFVSTCAQTAVGKTWAELALAKPACASGFKTIVSDYQNSSKVTWSSRHLDRVGAVIPSFPGTAVLKGKAYKTAKEALAKYPTSLDPAFGRNFAVDSDDVAFGYWGPAARLKQAGENLRVPFKDSAGRTWDFRDDEKSRRFMSLGEGTWAAALRASPAEPGLAALQQISTPQGLAYSAGGWSDLHPGAILKAAGCDDIVYVTRRGGESLFGQGVAKRLLGFPEVPWDKLATDPARKDANVIRNNVGDPQDMTSLWSRLFNLANPQSSMNRALDIFDSVVCTDWNRFDIQAPGAVNGLVEEGYRAPWISKSTLPANANAVDAKLGYRPFAGCVPHPVN